MKRLACITILMALAGTVLAGTIPLEQWTIPMFPNVVAANPTSPTATAYTIDAAAEKVGRIYYARKTGSIRRLVFAFATVTTGGTFNVRIEGISATGVPSGSLFGANCSGTITVNAADDNAVIESGDLTADCAVAQGDRIGIFLEQTGTGNLVLQALDDVGYEYTFGVSSNSTSGWVKLTRAVGAWVKYSDGTYEMNEPAVFYGNVGATQAAASNTNPNYVGNRYTLPFDAAIDGAIVWVDGDGDFDINMSNGGHPFLSTCTFTTAHRSSASGFTRMCYFNASVAVSSGTAFFLFAKPTTTTSSAFYEHNAANGVDFKNYDKYQIYKSTAQNPTSAGSWSVMTNRRLWIQPIFKSISYPDGAAGGTTGHTYAN